MAVKHVSFHRILKRLKDSRHDACLGHTYGFLDGSRCIYTHTQARSHCCLNQGNNVSPFSSPRTDSKRRNQSQLNIDQC